MRQYLARELGFSWREGALPVFIVGVIYLGGILFALNVNALGGLFICVLTGLFGGVPVAFIGLTLKNTPNMVAPPGVAGLLPPLASTEA